ncbi:GntR family transcriptional regulator [Nocardia sp. NPDC048505]|uniref:GntR family transcriptional regulator n=1 Tax=Nocardia sp. NPDC048505 TaxID=3155756 RepID=UPI0033F3733D
MTEPAYVRIAGEYARQIRNGELRPGSQLPSLVELASQHGVSEIIIRKVVALLLSQGLVRSVERRGTFVADRPNLVRNSPERQRESPETTFGNETDLPVQVDREINRIAATAELAADLAVDMGDEVSHVVTRASEGGRPISISDTYHLPDFAEPAAALLEETVADRLPSSSHAAWLATPPGELVKTVRQKFMDANDRVLMISDISYPRDRYEAFVFRMILPPTAEVEGL